MKVKVRCVSGICIIAILLELLSFISAFADYTKVSLTNEKLQGYKKYTDKQDVFCTEQNPDIRFIILDRDDDGYMVICDSVVLNREFDPDGTQMFDLNDKNNIAYYLNNDFISEGKLPDKIVGYIDYERVWETEGGSDGGNCPNGYSTKCGISLMSYTEFMKYYKKIGLQDDENKINWFLRSPLASQEDTDLVVSAGGSYASEGLLTSALSASIGGIKPVFWLKKNFFQDVRLSIPHLGEEAARLIRKTLKKEDIQNGTANYSGYELKRFGYTVKGEGEEYITIDIPNEPTYVQNSRDAYIDVSVAMSGIKSKEYTVQVSPDGTYKDPISYTRTVQPLKKEMFHLNLSCVPNGRYKNFGVRVLCNNQVIACDSKPVTLLNFCEDEPLYEYSKIGANFNSDSRTGRGLFNDSFHWLCSVIGIKNIRAEHRWGWMEDPKGSYRINKHKYWDDLPIKYNLQYNPLILGYGNPNYYSGDVKTWQNATDNLRFQFEMIDYLDNNGTDLKSLEIWNEPNLKNYWGSDSWVTYSQTANKFGYELKKRYPEKEIIGCSIASQNGEDYIDAFYRRGGLMYVDGFSCHPYIYPTNPDVKSLLRSSDFVSRRYEAGGWTTVSQTEVGYPTNKGPSGISYETQAVYMPKVFIYNDELDVDLTNIYCLENQGFNEMYNEHEFGIVTYDYLPKDACVSIAQMSRYIGNAEYIGRFPICGDSYAYIYSKLGKLIAVVWSVDKPFEYMVEKSIQAEDYFGNKVYSDDNGNIILDDKEKYLSNISSDYALNAIADEARTMYDEICAKELSDDVKEDIRALADEYLEIKNPTALQIAEKIDGTYNHCMELIDKYHDKTELKELAALLFRVHQFCIGVASYYASFDVRYHDSDKTVSEVNDKISRRKGNEPESAILFTDAMMRYANRYNKKSNEIKSNYKNSKKGTIGSAAKCDILAINVAKLAERFMELEEVDTSRPVLTFLEKADPVLYQGQLFESYVEVDNNRNADINGQIVIKDNNGNILGEPSECVVPSKTVKNVYFKGKVPENAELGESIYYIEISEGGKTFKTIEMDAMINPIVSVGMYDCHDTIDNMTSIDFDITSTYNEKLMGSVEVTPPEGWSFDSNNQKFVIDTNQTQKFKFNITQKKKVPFNEYFFDITVKDNLGKELFSKKLPLSFVVSVKAKEMLPVTAFDGDITGWEDAYPYYMNMPEKPEERESWTSSNLAVKSLLKWDENNFYVLVDAYDDIHRQNFSGDNLWNGDSVQLAIDALNDDTTAMGSDDYSYGFSYTSEGNESRCYAAAPGKPIGARPSEWCRVVRNKELNLTRYYISIPRGDLSPLKFEVGTDFGFNLCVNDADMESRERYVQITRGIADSQNPSHFKTFRLVGYSSFGRYENDKEYGFAVKINNNGLKDITK